MALLLLFILAGIAIAFGRTLLDRGSLSALPSLEKTAYAGALGLGIAAYGVYGLGLLGLLSFWPVTLWWLLLAIAGWRGLRAYAADLKAWQRQRKSLAAALPTFLSNGENRLILASTCFLLIFGVIAVAACFRPPGPLEWDALSYHLADPKLFLLQHRISILPTEHHSNFPFSMEMLFTVGLLYNGYALADLFHFLMAGLLAAGMIGFCSRMLRPLVGWLAAVVFVTTPMVLWEITVAYIDVGLALYTTLAAFAVVSVVKEGEIGGGKLANDKARQASVFLPSSPLLLLSAALMGFALGMKYLALVPFLLTVGLLLLARTSLRQTALFVGVALAIGAPWYVKNAVVMHNPVYPFAFKLFPGSRYWSAGRAAAYQTEQDKFGTKPLSSDARSKLLNGMEIPWHLLTRPNPWYLLTRPDLKTNVLYCNPGEYNFTALFGGVYAALLFPLAFVRRVPRFVRLLLWLGMGQILAWFVLSQVGRYLIQIMPLLGIVSAYAACHFAFGENSVGARVSKQAQQAKRFRLEQLPGILGIGAVFGQAIWVLISVCTLPMNASVDERFGLAKLGQMPSSISVPALLANLGQSKAWEADLHRRFDAYNAIQWINENTPPSAGVALVDETRGYYLDRPYLWANQQHSSYIPYETLQNGAELTAWFRAHKIQYALINLNQASQNHGAIRDPALSNGPNGVETLALEKWYGEASGQMGQDRGHQLMGDAVRSGLWAPVFGEHGCVVVQMGDPNTLSATNRDGAVAAHVKSNHENTLHDTNHQDKLNQDKINAGGGR